MVCKKHGNTEITKQSSKKMKFECDSQVYSLQTELFSFIQKRFFPQSSYWTSKEVHYLGTRERKMHKQLNSSPFEQSSTYGSAVWEK